MQTDIWQLGDAVADLGTQRIRRDGKEHRLTPRAAAVLRALIETGDRPLSRDAALDRVWGHVATGDEVVGKAINELRQALGDTDAAQRRYIETIPKLGYRLLCPVAPVARGTDPASQPPADAAAPARGADGDDDTAAAATTAADPAPPQRLRRSGIALAVGLAIAIAIAVIVLPWQREPKSDAYPAASLRAAFSRSPQILTPAADYMGYADLLPDGSRALFAAPVDGTVRVFARTFDGAQTRIGSLTGGADFALAVSHDGTRVAYQHFGDDGACRIRLHALADGTEREIGNCSTRFAEWLEFSPDDAFLLVPRMRPGDAHMSLHRLDLADGGVAPFDYPRDAAADDVQARWSPDARRLAIRRGPQPNSGLWIFDAAAGGMREVVPDDIGLDGYAWLPDGSGLVIGVHRGIDAGLWRVDAATGRREPLGLRGATDPVIDRAGSRLLFCLGTRRVGLVRQAIDGSADVTLEQPHRGERGDEWFPRLSADGTALAFLADHDGRVAVRVAREGQATRRLPDVAGLVPQGTPAFSAEGTSLVVPMRADDGGGVLFEFDLARGAWTRLGVTARRIEQAWLSPDDKWLYYVAFADAERTLWRRSRETGVEQSLARGLERGPIDGDADGGVYYIDAGRQALMRRAPDGTTQRRVDDMGYWTAYAWTHADDGIYVLMEPAGKNFGLYFVGSDAAPVLVEPTDGVATLGLAVRREARELLIARTLPRAHDLAWLPLPAPR
jgi:DNA-binding winged helix-turn-helix (wHTH) protein/Tol biopolymer transport system component